MTNRVIFIFALLILLPLFSGAQFAYFNSEQFWNRLALQPAGERPLLDVSDTAIIVASNRAMDTTNFRFLPEQRSESGIRYFFVYTKDGKWNVMPVATLERAVSLMPLKNRDWVVYTEGMGKFFTSDLDRGLNMAAQYEVNVLLMDYPSITAHKKRLGNYFFAKHNATIAYKDFVPVLDTLELLKKNHQIGTGHLSLFFHSMGNIVLQQIIKNKRLAELNEPHWVDNLVLNAACFPQRKHKRLLDQIRFAKRIYINYNPADYTLGGAYLMSKRYQLGKQIRRPLCAQASYVNFEKIAGEGHSNFLNLYDREPIPEAAFRYYNHILHGRAAKLEDTSRFRPSGYRGIGVDLLPQASAFDETTVFSTD